MFRALGAQRRRPSAWAGPGALSDVAPGAEFWTEPCKVSMAGVEVGTPAEGHPAHTKGTEQPGSFHERWVAWLEAGGW